MTDKKPKKPESIATESTYRVVSSVIDSNSLGYATVGCFYFDGVRVDSDYNFNDVSVSDINTDNMKKLIKK